MTIVRVPLCADTSCEMYFCAAASMTSQVNGTIVVLSSTLEKPGSVLAIDGQLPFRLIIESTNSESSAGDSPGASIRVRAVIDERDREIWRSVGMADTGSF